MPKFRHPQLENERFFPYTPLHKKLIDIEDMISTREEEKCDTEGCKYRIANVSLPCMEMRLCNKCVAKKRDNDCDKCEKEVEEWISFRDFRLFEDTSKTDKQTTKYSFDKCITQTCTNKRSFIAFPCGCFGYCESCRISNDDSNCLCGRKVKKWIKIFDNPSEHFECRVCLTYQSILCASTCGHLLCSSCEFKQRDITRKHTCPFCRKKKPMWTKIHYRNHVEQLKD